MFYMHLTDHQRLQGFPAYCSFAYCIHFFSVAVIKHYEQSSLQNEEFIELTVPKG